MQDKPFKVRDKRNKGWFYLDNEYLNGLGKHLGPIGISVYVSLCRHANEDQSCFPAQELIAKEIGVTDRTVKTYIKKLKEHNVIAIEREKAGRKWASNMYYLVDKTEWIYPDKIKEKVSGETNSPEHQGKQKTVSGETDDTYQGNHVHTKDTKLTILNDNTNKEEFKLEVKPNKIQNFKLDIDIPKGLNVGKWNEWMQYRKSIRKPLKERSMKMQIKLLEENIEDQDEIINQSIRNDWVGLFPLKQGRKKQITVLSDQKVTKIN